jgi:hypothetical protein
MENENLENETPKNEEEMPTPQSGEPEKAEPESKDLQSALAQKEHFREKVEKLQKELEEVKSKVPEKKNPEKTPEENVEIWEMSNDPLEVVELGKVLSDYSKEETEFVLRNAPTRNLEGIKKAVEDPMVQTAIQGMREKVKKEQQVPEPSSSLGGIIPEDASKIVQEGDDAVAKAAAKAYEQLERKSGGGEGI